ncbi:phospholipase D family protein [Bradyrhizobium sp. AZCC 1699]|uniref:phospholipase D family protein n=1 Tax=Bradyrhizobium sp. AZCC 1699 TaxID=3117024 RepID=UPI002FF2B4F2
MPKVDNNMPMQSFLTENELIDRIKLRIGSAQQIDIAVAWASDCNALDALKCFADGHLLRSIVGIAGNASHPNALRTLQKCSRLRIHNSTDGLFHPKLYIFHERGTRYCWVGSANLTRGGFEQNSEIVLEYEDVDGASLKWFEECWNSLGDEESSGKLLDKYERNWTPPRAPLQIAQAHNESIGTGRDQEGTFGEYVSDWNSFVAQLAEADLYWGARFNRESPITGEIDSWLETITVGQRVVLREDWTTLSKEDRYILLGRGYYGALGSMKAAGTANKVFYEDSRANLRVRQNIRDALEPCITANDERFPDLACDFIEGVSSIDGFAGGLATRFLALARPDRAISVNKGSSSRLATLTGLPRTSLAKVPRGNGGSYLKLLRWFEQQAWYSRPEPSNARERLYASARAALFDALVYEVVD